MTQITPFEEARMLVETAKSRKLSKEELSRLGFCSHQVKQSRLANDRLSKNLKEVEDAAEDLLVDQMRKQKINSVQEGGIKFEVSAVKYKPHVTDWKKFHDHILATGDFSLLERRPGQKAIAERWDDSKIIPGVEKFPVYSLVVTQP